MTESMCRYETCANQATFTCLCSNQGFCAAHLGQHVQENPALAHSTVPSIFRSGTEFSDFQTIKRDELTDDPAIRWIVKEKRRLDQARGKAFSDLDFYHKQIKSQLMDAIVNMKESIQAQVETIEACLMRREAELRRGLAIVEETARSSEFFSEQLFHVQELFDSSTFPAFLQKTMAFSLTQVKKEDAFADYFSMYGSTMDEELAAAFGEVLNGEVVGHIRATLVRPATFQHVITLLDKVKGVTQVSISSGSLTESQCCLLAAKLAEQASSLTSLDLPHINLNAEKLEELYEGLRSLHQLHRLNLEGNSLQDEGAKIASEITRDMRELSELNLSANMISELGANFIAQGLSPELKTLNVSSNAIGVNGLKALCQGLKRVRALETLNVSDINLEAALIRLGKEDLHGIASLQRLVLRDNQLNIDVFCGLLKGTQDLLDLDISSTYLTPTDLKAFSEALQSLPNLQRLHLRNLSIGYDGSVHLSSSLSTLIHLQKLDLSSCSLGKEAIIKLSIPLHRLVDMDVLLLAQNPLGRDGCPHLSSAIKKMTLLRKLDLTGCDLVPVSFTALATAFPYLSLLEVLVLRDNVMSEAGAQALGPVLSYVCGLRKLDLWNCDMKEEAASALSSGLIFLTKLEELNIGYNEFGPKGMKSLANSISKLTKLKSLNLWNVKLGAEGASFLSPALLRLPFLSELYLSSNNLAKDGCRQISRTIPSLFSLTRLLLSDNDIGDEGAFTLSQDLQHASKLQHLCLFSNNISPAGARTICIALSYVQSFQLLELQDNFDSQNEDVQGELVQILSNAEIVV